MEIQGTGNTDPIRRLDAIQRAQRAVQAQAASGTSKADEVVISTQARWRAEIDKLPEVRRKKIEDIRHEIESGSYETDEKLDKALDNLLREIS